MPKNIAKLQMDGIRKTIETKQMQTLEISLPIRDETRYFEDRFIYFFKEHILVFVRDITKPKQVEQKLRKSEEKLKKFNKKLEQMINERTRELKESEKKYKNERNNLMNILNSMEDGVYIVNQQFEIEFLNQKLIKEFGPKEGKKCYEYFHDRQEICPWCKNQDVFGGKSIRWEWNSFKNQKIYDLLDTPLKNPNGSISKLEIFRDITDVKQLEQNLKKSEEKYRDAYNRMIFYQNLIAHDVNNILNNVKAPAEMISHLQGKNQDIENMNDLINIIKIQASKGAILVKNVRKLSQLEESTRNLKKIEIFSSLQNSVKFTQISFLRKKIDFQIDSPNKKFFTKANKLISDAFDNILNNAVKYNNSPIVEILIKISKSEKKKKRYIKIEFIDNGIGISDIRKPLLFQKEFIKETYSNGMGLGLILVDKIVQSYEGIIKVKDRIKDDYTKGCRFIIYLPEAP